MDYTNAYAALALIAIFGLWNVLRRFFSRSPLDNVPGPKATSLWTGNLHQLFDSTTNGWRFHEDLSENYGPVTKFSGLLGARILFVSDPLALHHIVLKDQNMYERTDINLKTTGLLFGLGLLSCEGEQHRKQRKMLNPVFNVNHMRHMTPIFFEIANQLRDLLSTMVKDGPKELDVLIWLTHVALELIGQGGLGYSFNIINENAVSPYAQSIKSLVPTLFGSTIIRRAFPWLISIGPPRFRRFLVNIAPNKTVHKLKGMVDIMDQTTKEIYQAKIKALSEGDEAVLKQVGQGKDIMSILLRANTQASEEDRLPDTDLLGQMSILIFAAMDTTSSALSRILHLLAEHPEVQDRLRQEVTEAMKDGELSYDGLEKLPFLDAVCRETMRIYCPVPWVDRVAVKDCILPLSSPIRGANGTDIREIYVPKGTQLYIGIAAANRSKDIWGEDAREWKPERWLSRLPDSVSQAHLPGIYSNMMTFLGGGRACIGFKFSELEMKIVLATLLRALKFSPSEKGTTWCLGGIITPSVTGSTGKGPELVLKVETVAVA